MKLLYFSSTGNNIYIAERLGGELLSIPQLIKNNEYSIEDEVVGIIFPVYWGNVPILLKEYFSQAQVKCDYLFAICSYGSSETGAKIALYELNKLLKSNGKEIDYSNYVLMVDNFLPVFDMEVEKAIKADAEIDKAIDSIKEDIENRNANEINLSRISKVIASQSGSLAKRIIKKYAIQVKDEGCTQCGICVKVCPRANIALEDKPILGDNCEFCLGCVHHCKERVLNPKSEKGTERFINSHVNLSQIVKSNNMH